MPLNVQREGSREAKHAGFPYQVEAVEAIKDLEYAAVFHEQGLGKTKIAIDLALLWLRSQVVDSILFVTKKGLIANWRNEIQSHSHLVPRVLGQNRRENFFAFNSPARFYLTHYEVCMSERSRLKLFLKTRKVAVICDEAQKFKNPESNVAETLFELGPQFVRRVILTGTPIANRPQDIWALIYFLDGGAALGGDFETFKREVDLSRGIDVDGRGRGEFESAMGGLFPRISKFCVRETKASTGISLPTKTVENILVDAEERQAEIYRSYRDDFRATVVRGGTPRIDDADDILKRLLRLVQVASNPRLIDQSYSATPGKFDVLLALLDKAIGAEPATKAIVWTSFTENADWLANNLRAYGAVRVHGKMAIENRNRALEAFKSNEDTRVLVATPGAAKEGLTLTVASHAVFFDRSFSLDDYLQAQDRIHRISQSRPCFIYNLIMRNTADEWVDELLAAKHLAAQLGVGDIATDKYRAEADYGFAQTLERILGRIVGN
ncbi:MAG TPA: DEAD/DEAH box helicase [Gemmatimonadaceae bacterium]|nr:DEAD/DEAH box helicase [Gemmatimonadaceae bacterium]